MNIRSDPNPFVQNSKFCENTILVFCRSGVQIAKNRPAVALKPLRALLPRPHKPENTRCAARGGSFFRPVNIISVHRPQRPFHNSRSDAMAIGFQNVTH